MKYLIVNADDFGLTESINTGIAKAYKEGIVTSISFLPTGSAFSHAVELTRDLDLKEMGAHLSLTGTTPATNPVEIASLVSKNKTFHKSRNLFFVKFLSGSADKTEVYLELKNQLEKLVKTGIPVTNLSSHEHIHMLPGLLDIFIRLAREYDIKAIRCPYKEAAFGVTGMRRSLRSIILSYFGKNTRDLLDKNAIMHTEHFLGFLDSGMLNENTLLKMLMSLNDGVTELVTHPGFLSPDILDKYKFHINCEYELAALLSGRARKAIQDHQIKLITYSDLINIR